MTLEKFHILYSSDGTYTIIEKTESEKYGFSYKHKNLSYSEVLQCIKALKQGYSPSEPTLSKADMIVQKKKAQKQREKIDS